MKFNIRTINIQHWCAIYKQNAKSSIWCPIRIYKIAINHIKHLKSYDNSTTHSILYTFQVMCHNTDRIKRQTVSFSFENRVEFNWRTRCPVSSLFRASLMWMSMTLFLDDEFAELNDFLLCFHALQTIRLFAYLFGIFEFRSHSSIFVSF